MGANFLRDLSEAFHRRHAQVYGHANRGAEVEIINLRTVHLCRARPLRLRGPAEPGRPPGPKGWRRAYFRERRGFIRTPAFERASLPGGTRIGGPAILEQPDSTTVLLPGDVATVDRLGNLLIAVGRA
jgi:N-methylhydantoinase A